MPSPRLHRAFLVAVVVVALAAGLASTHGGASAQAPAADTITTQLRPGWNLVGWMGPDTTPARLFRDVPLLQIVAAWEADADRYVWARRGGAVPPQIEQITRGQGLFLWLRGNRAAQWRRPASEEGVLLTLPAGSSLVGWAGLDGTPIAEAVGRLGDALVAASRWDAEAQSYERYAPGAAGSAVLNHGDALWVDLSEERRWWQSGTARTKFVFAGRVAEEQKSALRDEMERVVAFFAERYGITTRTLVVRVDPGSFETNASHGLIRLGRQFAKGPPVGWTMAHEYFHVLQFHLGGQHPSADGSPAWLTEGTAVYGSSLYHLDQWGDIDDRIRDTWARESLRADGPLQAFEDWQVFHPAGPGIYDLGALATDWLVRRAAALADNVPFTPLERGGLERREEHAAHMEYYRLLRSSFGWQAAFKEAFGIGVNDFYAAFEEYRTALAASRWPHLADDEDTPVLVFMGEIPADTVARIRAHFEDLLEFSRERFGSGGEYTVFVAADPESAMAAHQSLLGWDVKEEDCRSWGVNVLFVFLTCGSDIRHDLILHHFHAAPARLAPLGTRPPAAAGYAAAGPGWLREGTIMYTEAVYRAVHGEGEPFSDFRRRHTTSAAGASDPLRAPAYYQASSEEHLPRQSLSVLAAEWLAQHAGESALFEYYRLLPSSGRWEEAFEGAFGIRVDDFYAAFEQYRAAGFTS